MKVVFTGAIFDPEWKGGEPVTAQDIGERFRSIGIAVDYYYYKRKFKRDSRRKFRRFNVLKQSVKNADAVRSYIDYFKNNRPDVIFSWFDYDVSVIYAAKELDIPIILSVHIHWPVCPLLSLYFDDTNKVCKGPSLRCGSHLSKVRRTFKPLASKSGLFLGLLTLLSLKGLLFGSLTLSSLNKKRKLINSYASSILVNSDYVKRKLIEYGYSKDKIKVIYIGVDTKFFDCNEVKNADEKIVLMVGGSDVKKGFYDFVKLADMIRTKRQDVRFIITGTTWSPSKYVDAVGYLDRGAIRDLICKSSIIVVPSLWPEPFGRVIIEAMACGKPVVAYASGGIPEIIEDGKTGFLVERGNIKDLYNKVTFLLKNQELAKEMGAKARLHIISEFNIKDMVNEHLKVIKSVVRHS
ncbi:MAG: glycosyltransferase family 4 protein [archaeon]|nr:glycosyltransferase family 4 protein [archaeon]MCP8313182.1 glycosyltransferase family 4 protein [archaeon]